MAVTYALVLALAACACAWHPTLPAERRAQYYLLHDDGAYQHGFDTGAGQWATADGDSHNQVSGEWKFVDDGGQTVHWAYTSGVQGYVPVLAGSPHQGQSIAAPPAPPAVKSSWQSPPSPTPSQHHPSVKQSGGTDDEASGGDASYAFEYQASDHSRQESSDANGNVQGNFRFKADDGVERRVDYAAGANTGFVARGDHLPVAPEVPQVVPEVQQKQVPQGQSWSSQTKQPTWSNAGTKNVAASNGESVINPDGSFQFSYTTDDHSRQESSDANGNVQGNFRFKADDGVERRVDYVAGANTGFVAKGDHLPVAPEVPQIVPEVQQKQVPQGQSWSSQTKQPTWSNAGTKNVAASNGESVINPDGSFQFSYTTDDHSRQESSDASGNVQGNFRFKADDGVERRVDYVAGANTGFVARGDHLPVAPEVPQIVPEVQQKQAPQGQSWSSQTKQPTWSNAGTKNVAASNGESVINPDGSFQFSYTTDDHSRQESSDANGNVQGNFRFKADDGVERRVDYAAGANTGFVARGDHLPVAPEVPEVQQNNVPEIKSWSGHTQQSSWSNTGTIGHVPVVTSYLQPPASTASSRGDVHGDDGDEAGSKAYSYSYDAVHSAKHESADEEGNVVGSFEFVDGAGEKRKLSYTVNGEEGFVAVGDHLPKPVEEVAAGGWSQGGGVQQKQAGGWSQQGGVQQKQAGGWSQGGQEDVQQQETGGWNQQQPIVVQSHQEDEAEQQQQAAEERALLEAQKAEEQLRAAQALEQVEAQLRKDTQQLEKDAIAQKQEEQRLAEELESIRLAEEQNQQQLQQEQDQQQQVVHQQQGRLHPVASTGQDASQDGSYSFAYSTDTQSVSQSGDGSSNAARGSYSFVAPDDAQRRTVDWTANARTGFVATGAHLPVAPALPIAPIALPASKHSSTGSSNSAWASKSSSHGVQTASNEVKTASHNDGNNGDGSYSYSYQTDNAHKQEVADKAGNVKGSFSYRGGDGVERKVEYTANDQQGFVATGDHLPSSVSTASSTGSGTSGGHVSTWTSSAKGSTGTSGGHAVSTGTSSSHGSRPYAPLPVVRTAIKTQHTGTAKGHGVWGSVQGSPLTKNFPEVEVTRYLPPDSPKKFGYVFDTKA